MSTAPINLDPVYEEHTINLDPSVNNSVPPTPAEANRIATRAAIGLNQPYDAVYKALVTGQENAFRQQMASEVTFRRNMAVQNIVNDVAREKGSAVTPEELKYIHGQVSLAASGVDPETVIEDQFAHAAVGEIDRFRKRQPDSIHNKTAELMPNEFGQLAQQSGDLQSKREYLYTKAQRARDNTANQSWIGWGLDFAKGFFPFYWEAKMRSNVTGSGLFTGGLLGSNLEEQAAMLFRLPPSQFKQEVDRIYDELQKNNPQAAEAFIAAMVGQSTSELVWNNVFTAVDLSSIATAAKLGKAGIVGVKTYKETKDAYKNLVKAVEGGDTSRAKIAESGGDLGEAAVQESIERLSAASKGTSDPLVKAMEDLPTHFKTGLKDFLEAPGSAMSQLVNRIAASTTDLSNKLMYSLANRLRVDMAPDVFTNPEAIKRIKEATRELFTGVDSAVLDVSAPQIHPVSNRAYVTVQLGMPHGELFMTPEIANMFKIHTGLVDAQVLRKGGGYYLQINKNIDLNEPYIKDFLLATNKTAIPNTWANSFFGRYRTPEETTSVAQRENAKVATYGASVLFKLAQERMKLISDLSKGIVRHDPLTGDPISFWKRVPMSWATRRTAKHKEMWEQWNQVVKFGKTAIDPTKGIGTPEARGYLFRTIEELQDHYQRHFRRMPTDPEIEAYFAHKDILEMDGVLRDIAVYRGKAGSGAESHRIWAMGEAGERVYSANFDGMRLKEFPTGHDTSIMWIDDKMNTEIVVGSNQLKGELLKQLKKDIAEGRKVVIEIYDPESRPLNGFGTIGDRRIQFIIANNVETKDLDWNQVFRRGGGHFDYEYEFYIKQARMVGTKYGNKYRHIYEGDTTIMGAMIRAEGQDFAKKLDQVRIYLREGNKTAARDLANTLPMGGAEVLSWFRKLKDPDGVVHPARLNLNDPIQVVPKNRMIIDESNTLKETYRNTFFDGTKSGSRARQNQVEYTGQRDAWDIYSARNIGTQSKPLWDIEPTKFIDPIPSMDRALTKIINSTFLNDYKQASVATWIEHAKNYLSVKSLSEINSAPFWHFHHAEYLPGIDPKIKANLELQRYQIQQLLGMPSKMDTLLHSAGTALADYAYKAFGGGRLQGFRDSKYLGFLDPDWVIPTLTSVPRIVRAATFHAKLGLFAIPQILVQSQTYAAIYSIAGYKMASAGSMGALFQRWSMLNRNPEFIKQLDKYATQFRMPGAVRWKAGEFEEAWIALRDSGFGNVAGEYALIDDAFAPKLYKNGIHSFLDAGAVFFREGERHARHGAWFTAYKEFREIKPVGALTDADKRWILNRADLLSVNMSRASSSMLHTGIMQFPAQFLSYQIRTAELFFGKRLGDTAKERHLARARMMGWYSMIYGVPGSLGLSGLPLMDSFRKAALEMGYNVGEDHLSSLLMEGLPAYIGAFVTGGGDARNGNWYNIQERYGVQGMELMREALSSDTPFLKLLTGAAGSTLINSWTNTDGMWRVMAGLATGNPQMFPVKTADVVDIFKEISSVNSAWRMVAALNTGKWLSKKESYLTDTTGLNAVFMSLTGLSPAQVSEMNNKSELIKQRTELQKHVEQQFAKEFRRGVQALKDNNTTLAQQYFTRALTYLEEGDYPYEKRAQAMARASRGYESVVNQIDYSYFTRDVPNKQKQEKSQQFQQLKQMQQK